LNERLSPLIFVSGKLGRRKSGNPLSASSFFSGAPIYIGARFAILPCRSRALTLFDVF
jgi:hypothetical protein